MAGTRRPGERADYVAIRRLADQLLPALVARLEASPLGELEVSQDGWRIRLRKPADADPGTERASPGLVPGHVLPDGPAHVARSPVDSSADRAPRREASAERGERARRFVASPAVGIFHPHAEATPGRPVRGGDVLGHVEVLGVPQEVIAPFDGVIGRLLVESGQVVEYGEQLMRIEAA